VNRPAGRAAGRAAGRTRPPALLLAMLLAGSLAGCGDGSAAAISQPPLCPAGDADAGNGVVLMAQTVPTASWVPCLNTAALPPGWHFQHLDARAGGSRFWLGSAPDGVQPADRAVEVRLEQSCDVAGATEIPSDREHMHQFQRVRRLSPTFAGERHYVFRGGCLTVVFRLDDDSPGEALALASQAVGVVSRADLRAQVHQDSDGRVELDPPREGDG
jgi:hypothetical protein